MWSHSVCDKSLRSQEPEKHQKRIFFEQQTVKILKMKLLLVCAFLCIGLASGAHIRRLTRETEAVIPSLVEEILKVELQSDLKQNNKVEVAEVEPVIKKIADEAVAEALLEEGKPVIVEIIKDGEPVMAILKSEPLASELPAPAPVMEKVEVVVIKDNLDSFRDEVIPKVETPVEPFKEAVIAEVKVDEVKMEQPALRNVVKEEIPQIEELRKIAPEEKEAVKESLPEPVVSLNVAQPVLSVEESVKTVALEPVLKKQLKEETVVVEKTEAAPEKVEIVEEKKEEALAKTVPLAPVVPETPIIAEIPTVAEIKEETVIKADTPIVTEVKEVVVEVKKLAPEVTEAKPVEKIAEIVPASVVPEESAMPSVEMVDPEVRQNNPIQQAITNLAQGVTSFAQNIPIISNLVGNSQNSVAADAPASDAVADAVGDEATTPPRPQFPVLQSFTDGIQNGFQTLGQNVQTFAQNAVNSVQGLIPNAASSSESAQPGPLASLAQSLGLRPATAAPAKDDDKPVEIPAKVEGEKAPEAEKSVEVVETQPEEKKPVEVVEVVAPAIVEEKDSVKIENWTKLKHL